MDKPEARPLSEEREREILYECKVEDMFYHEGCVNTFRELLAAIDYHREAEAQAEYYRERDADELESVKQQLAAAQRERDDAVGREEVLREALDLLLQRSGNLLPFESTRENLMKARAHAAKVLACPSTAVQERDARLTEPLRAQVAMLREQLEKVKCVLFENEDGTPFDGYYCPSCGGEDNFHERECDLIAALNATEPATTAWLAARDEKVRAEGYELGFKDGQDNDYGYSIRAKPEEG